MASYACRARFYIVQASQFEEKGTAGYTKVVVSKPLVLKKVLEQGYNAAWSDADIAWMRNPFTLFDKSADVIVAAADNSQVSEGGLYKGGKFAGKILAFRGSMIEPRYLKHCL